MTKVALVTGASRGLGAAFAEALAGKDAHVIALARTSGALEELDDRIRRRGGSASLAAMDISSDESLAQFAETLRKRWRRLDLLVHAAIHAPGLSPVAYGEHTDLSRAVRINVLATEKLIAFCDPLLRQAPRPAAVFFDDPCAGESYFGRYGCTKAAQIALAHSWKSECRNLGITVSIVTPRPMRTTLRARFFPGEDRSRLADPMDEAKSIMRGLRQGCPGSFSWLQP